METAKLSSGFKRRRVLGFLDDDFTPPEPYEFDPLVMEQLMVRWLARCNISFQMFECEEFRSIISYLNKQAGMWLPCSANTVNTWVERTYGEHFEFQKDDILRAKSKVHLWSDVWTDGATRAVLAIGCQYIDNSGDLRNAPISI